MEFLVASAIGILTAGGLYLMLRLRTFPVILGISLLTYAVNVFSVRFWTFDRWRTADSARRRRQFTDPLPQALVLTAIVISFGMTAVVVMIGLGAFLGSDDDHVDDQPETMTPKRRAHHDPLDHCPRYSARTACAFHRACCALSHRHPAGLVAGGCRGA